MTKHRQVDYYMRLPSLRGLGLRGAVRGRDGAARQGLPLATQLHGLAPLPSRLSVAPSPEP
jgi:hypothetical protein